VIIGAFALHCVATSSFTVALRAQVTAPSPGEFSHPELGMTGPDHVQLLVGEMSVPHAKVKQLRQGKALPAFVGLNRQSP